MYSSPPRQHQMVDSRFKPGRIGSNRCQPLGHLRERKSGICCSTRVKNRVGLRPG